MTQKQMTPADKAIQLLQNFGCTTMFSKDNNGYTLSLKTAKKCALIMVEEIIKLNEGDIRHILERGKKGDHKLQLTLKTNNNEPRTKREAALLFAARVESYNS